MNAEQDDASTILEWSTGLAGVQTYELLDELEKRGWKTEIRRRLGQHRLVHVSPRNPDLQASRKSEAT